MPICPLDNTQLVLLTNEVNTVEGTFYECPAHKGRFVNRGIMGLAPIPLTTISNQETNASAITTFRKNLSTGNLEYKVNGSSTYETISSSGSGDLKYLELNATGQAAGNLNLTDAAWNESKVQIDYIKVVVTSGPVTDFDIAVFEKDTFLEADKRYEALGLNSTDNWEDDIGWTYIDDDTTKEAHIRITENAGGPGTYSIQMRGVKLV
ncbi:MAG: hypothetical protein Q7K45_04985 [Nanoarchaeota archaeon]|nr:hypothetical protein [Nanoarchaeota archaeon]